MADKSTCEELEQRIKELENEIEKHKRVDEALRESEEKYRNLVNLLPDPVAIAQDYRLKFVNQAYTELFGYTIEEIEGLKPSQLVLGITEDEQFRRFTERMAGNTPEPKHLMLNHLTKDGKTISCEATGNLIEYSGQPADLVVIRDITDRSQAEKALIESEQLYRTLVETSPHGIQELDAEMVIKYSNKAYCEMVGFSSEELMGKPVYTLAHPKSEQKRMWEYAKFVVDTEPLPSTYNTCLLTRSGKVIEVETDWNYKRDNRGALTGFITITTDITARKRLQDQLIRSERLAATGQLAITIAHEINSPLQGVKALLYSIEHSVHDDQELLADVGFINMGIKNIAAIVKNLLDLNRPGKEKKQETNINQIIEQTISLLQGHLRKNKIAVSLNLSPEIPDIVASPQQLGQVFLNLINNAVEAAIGVSKPDSRLPKRGDYLGEITLSSRRDKEAVVVKVSDNGPGLEEKELERIFDPFYTRKKIMGMGIGLSVCHDIINAHGGTIVADNMNGGGAVFTITLPY